MSPLDSDALNNAAALGRLQLGFNLQALRESPSAYRQGLEAAGFNPILAVQGAGSSASSIQLNPYTYGSGEKVNMHFGPSAKAERTEDEKQLVKANLRIAKADAAVAESDAELTRLENSARVAALEGNGRLGPNDTSVDVLTYEGWKQLRDNIAEELRKNGYTESEARARALDLMGAAKDVSSVVNTSARSVRDFRKLNRLQNRR